MIQEPIFIKYPSINQFRNTVKDFKHNVQFEGLDEDGNPIMNIDKKLPKVKVHGTEKIHGTNAGICYHPSVGIWAQSRNNVITLENDNAGFAFFVESYKEHLESNMKSFDIIANHDYIVSVFGEWAGGNIQKNSACSGLEKQFFIFEVIFTKLDEDDRIKLDGRDLDMSSFLNDRIHWIYDFQTYELEIDFEEPQMYQNKMIELVEEVEKCSPLGKRFGKENIGEGIVFRFQYYNKWFIWKVKGDKHASGSRVTKLKVVDEVKEKAKATFVNEYACTLSRLEQMKNETFDIINGGEANKERMGDFIRAVIKDVMKEEKDILVEMNLEPKEVNSKISKVCRDWLISELDKEILS